MLSQDRDLGGDSTSHAAAHATRKSRGSRASASGLTFHLAATAAERAAIYRLRHEIYALECGFRTQGAGDYQPGEDAWDAKATHLYATLRGELVGALRVSFGADDALADELLPAYELARFQSVVPRAGMAVTSRLALAREHRAGPAALELLIESARLQQERGVALSFGDSPLGLLPFYSSIGFRLYTAPYHHAIAGTLVPFVLAAGDLAHLRAMDSPLLVLADATAPELDETAQRLRELLPPRPPLLAARSHANPFWAELFAALGPPPFERGPLAGLAESELESLLGPSYLVDWPPGRTLLRPGPPISERWLLLSGPVEVNGVEVPPLSILGGASRPEDRRHELDARIGRAAARLLSLDERRLQRALAAKTRAAARLAANLHAFSIQ